MADNNITKEVIVMAKNKQNKPKKSSKIKGELTSMADNSNDSRVSKTGFQERGGNHKENQLR